MSCDTSCTNFETFFREGKPDFWVDKDKVKYLCENFIELSNADAIISKDTECVDPRDILTGGVLFTAKQLELNMTLPYETCATELEWWWWVVIIVVMLLLVGAIGFFIYKIITRRKQSKPKNDKKVELDQMEQNATVSVHESTLGQNDTTLDVKNNPITQQTQNFNQSSTMPLADQSTLPQGIYQQSFDQTMPSVHSQRYNGQNNFSYQTDPDDYV